MIKEVLEIINSYELILNDYHIITINNKIKIEVVMQDKNAKS